jgi:hypothetical protein
VNIRNERSREMRKIVLRARCETCLAIQGMPCTSLSGPLRYVSFHSERLKAAAGYLFTTLPKGKV